MKTLLPNEIVVAQCCDEQKWLVGSRIPDTSVIVPPTPPGPDPYFYAVVLLVGSESGVNIDESLSQHGDGGGTPTTTRAAFGKYSISPVSQYIDYGNKFDDFNLAPHQMTEFTIEAWIYLNATLSGTTECIFGKSFFGVQWYFGVDNTELRFTYQNLESGFGGNGAFTNLLTTGANIVGGQWYYVAVCKDAAKHFRLYVNGVMKGRFTPNDASIDGTEYLDSLSVGHIGLFGTNEWNGEIDEIRITKGVARYRTTTSYPVPTRAWPRPPPPPV